jgi:HAE1 family hydrophobic/amphiphilic exporter-1
MWLANTSVRRPVFATMVIAALIVFGFISIGMIGVDLMPQIDFPVVTITTILPGADPETVELEVSDKIEEAVNTIDGVDELRSISSENISIVIVMFELEKDIDVVVQDVRDKIAGIRGELPDQIEAPLVEKLDFNSDPILTIAVSGRDVGADKMDEEIRRITEATKDRIKERLQTISGVGSVRMVGGQEREVRVWLEADKLHAYRIPVEQVMGVLAAENVKIPGGRIESASTETVIKTLGELESVEDFNNLVVAYADAKPVTIREIGYVEDGLEEMRSISYLNGKRAVALEVRKVSGANTVAVAQAVKEELEAINESLPEDIDVSVAVDSSVFIEDAIEDVQWELIVGGILAVLVILFFLRDLRTSLISAVAIPTSVIATFTFINFMGFTINMLTMLALTISVGMLIDDAVVVLENIYRHMEQEKKDRRKAAMEATQEIGLAVMAATFTIFAVFVPISFMTGIVGRFFYEFGLTVAFAVAVSLFVSFTLTPMLCSLFLKLRPAAEKRNIVYRVLTKGLRSLDSGYRALLAAALRHRVITVLLAVAIFAFSLFIAGIIPSEFQPPFDESQFTISIEAPLGSSLDETIRYVGILEDRINEMPGIVETFTAVGGGAQEQVNRAKLDVKIVQPEDRSYTQLEFMDYVRERLLDNDGRDGEQADIGNLRIAIGELQRGGSTGFADYQLQYSIRGHDLNVLQEKANAIKAKLQDIPGFVDLNTSYSTGKPEVGVRINRKKATDLGVSVASVATTIRALFAGQDVTTFKEGGEQYDVRVQLMDVDRDDPEDINRLMVRLRSGKVVDLAGLVDLDREFGPVQIERRDRMREVLVRTNLTADLPLGVAVQDIYEAADEVGIPTGYVAKIVGMARIMQESFQTIFFTLFLAIIIIYMVLASQFESFIHPFTIMISLPLSIVGAIGILLLTGNTLNILTLIGIIMLMGIVTKNSILLVDYTNTLRGRGMERTEAILLAGPRRLRPILMTAFSTIFGSVPVALALGSGGSFRAPMALAVIGGLLTSTLLTLVIIPVVYSLLDDLASIRLFSRLRLGRKAEEEAASAGGGSE